MTGDTFTPTGPGFTDPLVPPGHRVTPAAWYAALNIVRVNGKVLLRVRETTNQATTAAAKLNRGQALERGLKAYTEFLEPDGPVGIWLEAR